MRKEKLSKLLDISIGRTPSRNETAYWGAGHKWVSIRDLNSKVITHTKEQITDLAVTETRCRIVPKGTLLFSFKLTIGKMAFAGCDLFTNEAIAAFLIKDEKKLNSAFLYYALSSATYGGSNQAAMGKTLNSKSLAEIEIPIPPLDDQIRIAFLLSKVEVLISQRKQQLKQLNDLLKSVFLEMFGDPVRNEKKWDKKPCSEVSEIVTGYPFKSDLYTKDQTQLKLCGGLIIYPHSIEWDKCNYWPKEYLPGLEQYSLEIDDIVLAMDRPWISSGLKICTVNEVGRGSLLVQRTARLRAKSDVEQFFLYAHMKDASFTKHCRPTETTVPHISIKDIQSFQVLCPPKKMQLKFSSIAKKIESIKFRYQRSLADLEALYGVLSQKAFKDELDLTRVPLPGIKPKKEKAVIPEPLHTPSEQDLAIGLPDSDKLLHALENTQARAELITQWLEAYQGQLGSTPFSVQHFMATAQTRLTQLHPNKDFELGTIDYELIKTWVFEALATGTLTQAFDDDQNRIAIKTRPASWGSW